MFQLVTRLGAPAGGQHSFHRSALQLAKCKTSARRPVVGHDANHFSRNDLHFAHFAGRKIRFTPVGVVKRMKRILGSRDGRSGGQATPPREGTHSAPDGFAPNLERRKPSVVGLTVARVRVNRSVCPENGRKRPCPNGLHPAGQTDRCQSAPNRGRTKGDRAYCSWRFCLAQR
jgi:hypothetical protein